MNNFGTTTKQTKALATAVISKNRMIATDRFVIVTAAIPHKTKNFNKKQHHRQYIIAHGIGTARSRPAALAKNKKKFKNYFMHRKAFGC